MDAASEIGRTPLSRQHICPEYEDEQADAGWNCRTRLARLHSKVQKGTGKNIYFCSSADREEDWKLYPVGRFSSLYVMTIQSQYFQRAFFILIKVCVRKERRTLIGP